MFEFNIFLYLCIEEIVLESVIALYKIWFNKEACKSIRVY